MALLTEDRWATHDVAEDLGKAEPARMEQHLRILSEVHMEGGKMDLLN